MILPRRLKLYMGNSRKKRIPFLDCVPCHVRRKNVGARWEGFHPSSSFLVQMILKLMSAVSACIAGVCDRTNPERQAVEIQKRQDEIIHTQLFLSALSHELKTPLTAIIASTGLLIEELEENDDGRLLKIAQNISRSSAVYKTGLPNFSACQEIKMKYLELTRKKSISQPGSGSC